MIIKWELEICEAEKASRSCLTMTQIEARQGAKTKEHGRRGRTPWAYFGGACVTEGLVVGVVAGFAIVPPGLVPVAPLDFGGGAAMPDWAL
jgi:hypothetical protein